MFRSITSRSLICAKALLLAAVGAGAASLIYLEAPRLETVLLLAVCVFGFGRAYYFCFYVLDQYLGTNVSGLMAGLLALRKRHVEHREVEQVRVDSSVPDRD